MNILGLIGAILTAACVAVAIILVVMKVDNPAEHEDADNH